MFVTTREAIERIKDIISGEIDGFVFDKDVANKLSITQTTLASRIKRDSMPLKEIALFCYENNIDIKKIIFVKNEGSLV